ncbi:hypothetical protein BZA77DRAFT_132150 [Pyronema omphalodes]|nr:hypothetical protein BZA77DRAFT_132150 [Pyronema omphalodes]
MAEPIRRYSVDGLKSLLFPATTIRKECSKKWAIAQLEYYGLAVPEGSKDVVLNELRRAVKDGLCDQVTTVSDRNKVSDTNENEGSPAKPKSPAKPAPQEDQPKRTFGTPKKATMKNNKNVMAEVSNNSAAVDSFDEISRDQSILISVSKLKTPDTPSRRSSERQKAKLEELLKLVREREERKEKKGKEKERPKATTNSQVKTKATADTKHKTEEQPKSTTARTPRTRNSKEAAGKAEEKTKATPKTTPKKNSDAKDKRKSVSEPKSQPAIKKTEKLCTPYGHYEVTCKDISEGWDNMRNLTLAIQDDPDRVHKYDGDCFVGDFSFGVLSGIMRFRRQGETWDDFEIKDDYSDLEQPFDMNVSRKRKFSGVQYPKKRLRSDASIDPLKFHFIWRGRDTAENIIQLDNNHANKGWLKFEDHSLKQFQGEFDADLLGKGTKFSGKLVGKIGRATNKRWSSYSERQYEEERVGRW